MGEMIWTLLPSANFKIKSATSEPAPYAAVIVGVLVNVPMLLRESELGWPMLQHRQITAGGKLVLELGPSSTSWGASSR